MVVLHALHSRAIEEELEILYDAYYEELELYAHHQQQHQLGIMRQLSSPPSDEDEAHDSLATITAAASDQFRRPTLHDSNAEKNSYHNYYPSHHELASTVSLGELDPENDDGLSNNSNSRNL